MRIRLLPSAAGRDSQYQSLTTFLVNDRIAIDGGSIGFALTPEEIGRVGHIVVTHAHSDHTASLPIYIAEAFTVLNEPIVIYGIEEVISALRTFVFNNHIWPNFEKITLTGKAEPTIRFQILEPHETVNIAGMNVTAIPVNHIVPTIGVIVEHDSAAVAFTSDTYTTDEIWEAARRIEHLKAVFVDVSFPNELGELAAASKHLTPELLVGELKKLNREVEVYAVHIKPMNRDDVIRQLSELNNPAISIGEINRVYEW
ncbi:MAG TPA: 3',5'-cyclic-nucleotide phosphodiesterase [Blastocatellia bacterium]|nr:3',5'-cyclic-nucleotide phosphodiesterase [Blastocatellia bacterium]